MRNTYKILIVTLIAGFLFVLIPVKIASANCTANIQVNLPSGNLSFNRPLTITSQVTMGGFVNGGTCDGYCSVDGTICSNKFYVYYDFYQAYSLDLSDAPPQAKNGLGNRYATNTINMTQNKPTPYGSSVTVTPSDLIDSNIGGFTAGDSMPVKAYVVVCKTGGFFTNNCTILTSSGQYSIKLTSGTYNIFACTGPDAVGKTVYICDSKNDSTCVNTTGCTDRTQCAKLSDSTLCGKEVSTQSHKECQSNVCVVVPGAGTDNCTGCAAAGGGGGGGTTGGGTTGGGNQTFTLQNPIGISTFQDLVNIIGTWIFNLSIPLAVIVIIYAGILLLTSGGSPKRYELGKKALTYAVIGLAIVLIGKGFVSLIQSILSLKGP
jgi:hypothetical protein